MECISAITNTASVLELRVCNRDPRLSFARRGGALLTNLVALTILIAVIAAGILLFWGDDLIHRARMNRLHSGLTAARQWLATEYVPPPVAGAEVIVVDTRGEKRIAWRSASRYHDSGGKWDLRIGNPIDLSSEPTTSKQPLLTCDFGSILWRNMGGTAELSLDRRAGLRSDILFVATSGGQRMRGFVSRRNLDNVLLLPGAELGAGKAYGVSILIAGDDDVVLLEIFIEQ